MTVHFLNTKTSKLQYSGQTLDPAILNNISVTAPYFALRNLRSSDGYVYCEFTTELINIAEEGPISGAEVGRHMAILGSVVLAKENPRCQRHYYLATDALITRCSFSPADCKTLTAKAKMVSLDRKKGVVSGTISDIRGNIIYQVEVTYTVLLQGIFERMFADKKAATPLAVNFNPYVCDTVFHGLKLGAQECSAAIDEVKIEDCPGHFNNYPALPVARMGTSMGKLGGLHFMHLNPNGKKKYFIAHAELHARQLVFTGEKVKFRTEITDPNPEKGMVIRTVAYTDQIDFIAETICNFHY